MEPEKIVLLATYRAERLSRANKAAPRGAGVPLPSIDYLWQLLDKNISLAAWNEQQCRKLA